MKTISFSLAFTLFTIQCVTAKTYTSASYSKSNEFVAYSKSDFINYHERKPRNRTMFAGGMIAATGGGCFVGGGFVLNYLTYTRDIGATNYSMQNLGFGLMIGGVALAVTGLAFAIKGHHEKKWGWSLGPTSAKPNELGIACNF